MKLTTLTSALVLLLLLMTVMPAEAGKGGQGGGKGGATTPTPSGYEGVLYLHSDGTMDETAPPAIRASATRSAPGWTSDAKSFGSRAVTVTWWNIEVGDGDTDFRVSLYQTGASGDTLLVWGSARVGGAEVGTKHTVSLGDLSTTSEAPLRVAIERIPGHIFPGIPHPGFGVVLHDSPAFPSCVVVGTGTC